MPNERSKKKPATILQTCIVHPIRNSLDYARWKDRKAQAAAIKPARSAEAALAVLETLAQVRHPGFGAKGILVNVLGLHR